jgi:dynein light chain 4
MHVQAKYPLVKYTDMTLEVKEEALDICITAVEKYASDMEKCTQVSGWGRTTRLT